jgi:hypothetical protein
VRSRDCISIRRDEAVSIISSSDGLVFIIAFVTAVAVDFSVDGDNDNDATCGCLDFEC